MNTELSSEARRLIDAARGFDSATAEDRVRVQARLLTQLAAGAGLSAVAGSARAAGTKGWVTQTFARALPKAALGAGAAAAVAVGVALSWPTAKTQVPTPTAAAPASAVLSPARESVVEVMTPEAKNSDPPSAPEVAEAPPAVGKQPATPRPTAAAAPRPTKAAAREAAQGPAAQGPAAQGPAAQGPAAQGHLDEELQLVSAARAALKQGEAEAALERLGEYQQRFPEGALTVEAQALRVDALCAAGERGASAEAAEAFLKHWPESPLAARVRAACQ